MDINEIMIRDFTNLSNLEEVINYFNQLKLEYNKLYSDRNRLNRMIFEAPDELATYQQIEINKLNDIIVNLQKNIKNLQTRKLSWKERFLGKITF